VFASSKLEARWQAILLAVVPIVLCVEVEIEFNLLQMSLSVNNPILTADDVSNKMDPCQAMTTGTRVWLVKNNIESNQKHLLGEGHGMLIVEVQRKMC
jgi:hypothetical protein